MTFISVGQSPEVRTMNSKIGNMLADICSAAGLLIYNPEEKEKNGGYDNAQILFAHQIDVLKKIRCVVMFVNGQSTGVGGEAVAAYLFEKPILLLTRKYENLSLFLQGNPNVKKVVEFCSLDELKDLLSEAFGEVLMENVV